MKRIILICAALMLTASASIAEEKLDFSDWTTEQLEFLVRQANEEIVNRREWSNVKVPAGQWVIGKDIPAGEYEIDHSGSSILSTCLTIYEEGSYSTDLLFVPVDGKLGKVILETGKTVEIDHDVIFNPVVPLAF